MWHDPLVRLLASFCQRAGITVTREARSLFADVLDQDLLHRPHCGIIPDLVAEMRRAAAGVLDGRARLVRCLFDTKTVFAGNTLYQRAARGTQREAAVEARARAVPVDYIRHARQQDHAMLVRRTREAAGPDADPIALARRIAALPTWGAMAPGPCLTRLREYPPCEGLAFGSYGEASPAVYTFLGVVARAIAEREWREMGSRSESEARGIISTQLYRQLCVATVGGHMRVIHARAHYLGRSHDAAIAEAERQRAPDAATAAAWPAPRPLAAGPRGGG